jgi:creatinine amidohydrolase
MAAPSSHLWQDWQSQALAAHLAALKTAGRLHEAVAVLPIAATEQHGPHLPLCVDSAIVQALCDNARAALPAAAPIWFLPTQAVGLSVEHQAFTGTLSLRPETALALWQDIVAGVAACGIRKLLIFNSHGGNMGLMDVAARQIRAQHGMAVWQSAWFNLPLDAATQNQFSADEHRFGVHAGQIETALMLAIAPHLVDSAKAQHFASSSQARAAKWPILGNGRAAKLGWQMQDYNAEGAAGNALAATAAQGQAVLQDASAKLVQMLQEISAIGLDEVLGH